MAALYLGWLTAQPMLNFGWSQIVRSIEPLNSIYGFFVAMYFGHIASLAVLVIALRKPEQEQLRRAIYSIPARRALLAAVAMAVLSVFLNNIDVWPFYWRYSARAVTSFAHGIVDQGHWTALGVWLLLPVVVTPLLEEVIFRYGILRFFTARTGSPALGVLGSALAFGAIHLGYPFWAPDRIAVLRTTQAFVFGLVLATVTVRSNGLLWPALVLHTVRNGTEMLFLGAVVLGW